MRLFVAVEIDDPTRRVAEALAHDLRAAIGRSVAARWVPPENMHLTVRFIGHVDDGRVPPIIETLAQALDVPAFDVELGGCGVFPPGGPPRVLWIGLTQGLPNLAAMHDAFDRRLARFGFEPETRPFSAHLTLARVKDAPKGAAAAVRQAVRAVPPRAIRFNVSRATIFQSRTSPKGSRYTPLAHAMLTGDRRPDSRS
jgi:RNA 2',3'-cyclic 3'-phosphodiesterase